MITTSRTPTKSVDFGPDINILKAELWTGESSKSAGRIDSDVLGTSFRRHATGVNPLSMIDCSNVATCGRKKINGVLPPENYGRKFHYILKRN